MMHRPKKAYAYLITATLAIAVPASAGLDVKTRMVANGKDAGTSRIRSEGNSLRIDIDAPPSGQGATFLVFDATKETLYVLRPEDRTYIELDKDFAATLSRQMDETRRMLQAQMKNMPPDQRAMMEKMMENGSLPFQNTKETKKRKPLEVRNTGESDTVGGKPCTLFALSRDGEPKADVCVASWESVGLRPDDMQAFRKFGAFQARMSESMSGAMPETEQPFELFEQVDGFPLRTRRYENETVTAETFYEELQQTEVSAESFEIPAGYTKIQMGMPSK